MKTKKEPLVSIIIPTYNSAKHIQACIDSIHNQTYQKFEIIVVDQSSSDDTPKVVRKNKVKLLVLPKPKFYSPPTQSRNYGARSSHGDILYHLDSDMQLSEKLLAEIVVKMSTQDKVGAMIVHEEDITKGFWSTCKAFERKCYWGNDRIESARVVKREVFEKVNGYDESLNSGEDFDIHRRYKQYCKIGFAKNVVYHNLGNLTFLRTVSKKYNYGKTASLYFQKHHSTGQSLLKEQLSCYYKNRAEIVKHPLTAFGSLVLKGTEFAAGGLGLLTSKL